jgi:hypothetical protein
MGGWKEEVSGTLGMGFYPFLHELPRDTRGQK